MASTIHEDVRKTNCIDKQYKLNNWSAK